MHLPASDGVLPRLARRFHGTVSLNPLWSGAEAVRIADAVIQHLAGLVGSEVPIVLEISAEVPAGTPEHVVRTVTENCETLRFAPGSGFELE